MLEQPKPLITIQENGGTEIYSKEEKNKVLLEMIDHMRVLQEEFENPDTKDERKLEIDKELEEVTENFLIIRRTV